MSLKALFQTAGARLLRKHWGARIREVERIDEETGDPSYLPRDTGVHPLAQELGGIFDSEEPFEIYEPIKFNNNGTGPVFHINNGLGDSSNTINITSGGEDGIPSGGSTQIGSNGIRITGDGLQIAISGDENFYNSDDDVTLGARNFFSSLIIVIPGGVTSKATVIRQFTLIGTLSKVAGTTTGTMYGAGAPVTAVTLNGKYFPSRAIAGDMVLAYYDWDDTTWYAFASNRQYYTGSVWAFSTANPTLTVNSNCTITLGNLKECVIVDGQVYSREA